MKIQLEKYIFPVTGSGEKEEGVGVVVGNLLITAGHVVNGMDRFSIIIDKKEYDISKNQILALSALPEEPKPTDYDICVINLNGINSLLTLATELPNIGKQLISISYKQVTRKIDSENCNGIFGKSQKRDIETHHSEGYVNIEDTNFFGCDMSEPLEEGRSGSPIIAEDKVYGILTGGKDNGKFCVYQSSKSILEFLKIHNIKV